MIMKNNILRKLLVLYIKLKQKSFKRNGKVLKYLLFKNSSDNLIISFSGFAASANKPVYNYVKTLSEFKSNKLFILDDFGYEKRGSYYLGEDGLFFVSEMVIQLINELKKKMKIKSIICVGSSKGGTAAIYFGLKLGVESIIVGAPQYYLGNYLNTTESHKKILNAIMGNTQKNSIEILNGLISNAIINYSYPNKPKIFIHYSYAEHTYSDHILFLVNQLNKNNFTIVEDTQQYTDHFDVAKYFPEFIRVILIENSIK